MYNSDRLVLRVLACDKTFMDRRTTPMVLVKPKVNRTSGQNSKAYSSYAVRIPFLRYAHTISRVMLCGERLNPRLDCFIR